jgi:hypothetical protein
MNDTEKRNFFIHHLEQQLIGVGAVQHIVGDNPKEELLNNYPLQTYYSGILYPERSNGTSKGDIDNIESQADTFNNDIENEDANNDESMDNSIQTRTSNQEVPYSLESNSYFASNMGLTFCVGEDAGPLQITFSAGKYKNVAANKEVIKIKIKKNDFDKLKADNEYYQFPFEDNIAYKAIDEQEGWGWFYMQKSIEQTVGGTKSKISEYRKKLKDLERNPYDDLILKKLDFITGGVFFKRQDLQESYSLEVKGEKIQVNKDSKTIDINEQESSFPVFTDENNSVIAKCYFKVIKHNHRVYVKLLLANTSEKHPINRFNFGNELLNEKCLFQSKIKVEANLQSYKSDLLSNPYDKEAETINYQYRHLQSYGIGHSCAVYWEGDAPKSIETTYLPQAKVRSASNDFRKENEHFKEIATIKNLSVWTPFSREEICEQLKEFAKGYATWITEQTEQAQKEPEEYQKYAQELISTQKQNSERLYKNIELLKKENDIFDAFLLANTAMYIQIVISGRKERELSEFQEGENFQSLAFFQNYKSEGPITYYPFQLAFLLLNIESITNPASEDRNLVDLLWFPTGGGKTEAYLAVTAMTVLWRRMKNPNNFEGVSVIMRYTLRLLTAQQFERASRLIVALEFLNRKRGDIPIDKLCNQNINLGDANEPISIGMWVGGATTPNDLATAQNELNDANNPKSLHSQIQRLNNNANTAEGITNVFQVSACPWCGCKTITRNPATNAFVHGFYANNNRFQIRCVNNSCSFNNELPIDVVDESIYNNPPTLLFATVDKFAMIAHREEGHRFFNSLDENKLPPDLIIQDELHLLNGPLGSLVGLFELLVELLASRNECKPKIIASTATTRNTDNQVANLYGNRKVNIFPPPGITYDDNYFSFTDTKKTGQRLHIGFMPTGKSSLDTQVRALLPNLLIARILLFKHLKDISFSSENEHEAIKAIDNYWTIASYYNSLKDVGKIYNKVNDEITGALKRLHEVFGLNEQQYDYRFNQMGLINRTTELTSRIESTKVKTYLNNLSKSFALRDVQANNGQQYKQVQDTVDLLLASNMFSVGIDISRLNVMLMNGQPKNVAEYIQASSRVARKTQGLVINLLDANRAREKSYFENYLPFHQAYYKYVEPLTVTPFTEITFNKLLNSLLISFVRHKGGLNKEEEAKEFPREINISELKNAIQQRIPTSEKGIYAKAESLINTLVEDWLSKINTAQQAQTLLRYKQELIQEPQKQSLWALMKSMREVDTNSVIEVILDNTYNAPQN